MSEQENFDKRIAELVAHKTPDEMARELLQLQDATAAAEAAPTPEEGLEPDGPLDDPDDAPDDELPEDDRE